MENDTVNRVPLLHDCGGPIYDPGKALTLFDLLVSGDATELLKDERFVRTMRRAMVARYPAEPKYRPGIHGSKYDSYTCQNCGFGVTEAYNKFCPSCGQVLTSARDGRRATQEEEEQFWNKD